MNRLSCRTDIIILAVLCFISFFVFRDVVDMDLMEARNFVTAREMVSENNWLVPTMNGEIRLAKPPLPTWFAAVSSKIAGTSDDLALLRLPNALAACLMVFSVYGLCWAMGRNARQAFLSAAMLTTSVMVIEIGRIGSWDIFCHAFMAAALWALWAGLDKRAGKWSFVLAGVCLCLSFMSKGPVSFYALFLPFFVAYISIFGLTEIKRQWQGLALALVICLLLSSWWPLYVFVNHADLGLLVAQNEIDAWTSRHVQPFWYYWHFLVFTGGWLIWAFAALIRPYAARRAENRRFHAFFLLWFAATLVLLSVIPEKKERYLLPAMIPLFLLAGDLAHGVIERFSKNRDQPTDRALVLSHASLLGLLSTLLPFVLIFFLKKQDRAIDGVFICYGLGFWAAAFFLIRFLRRRQVERLLLTTIAFLALTTLATFNYYGVLTTKNREYKRVDSHLLARGIGKSKVYVLGESVDMKVIWDLGRRVYPCLVEEVVRMLEEGEPLVVLSKGEPLPLLPKEFHDQVLIRGIDTFDYNKEQPDKRKIHLSLLQLREARVSTPAVE
jgi:4-amino-4-deoxy-L-arabinose transferase-like glycosyltransferase